MIRPRATRPVLGLLLAGACVVAAPAPAATAANYTTYVGCADTATTPASHVCQIGDEPGAFFESPDVDVEYEVCVTFPSAETLCAEEQEAEAGTLYVNTITTDLVGNHLVSWYVKGVEVASWSLRMDAPPPPAPKPAPTPTASPAAPPAPAVVPPVVIGCSLGYETAVAFVAHPRRCTVFRDNRRDHADEIRMIKLHWRAWGEGVAVAHGRWKYCGMGPCTSGPLRATAAGPVLTCGHLAYTRLTVHIDNPSGRDPTYSLQPPSC
jgi:hypothetical protein